MRRELALLHYIKNAFHIWLSSNVQSHYFRALGFLECPTVNGCVAMCYINHISSISKCFSHLVPQSHFVWPLVFFSLLVTGCGDVLHKSQQRRRGRDLSSCLWQDQIRWLLSKSGNHVVKRFRNLAPFLLENCFGPKIGPEIGPGPCAPPST